LILQTSLKSEHEKEYLLLIEAIKKLTRVPKITEDNKFIKEEITKKIKDITSY